MATPNTAKAPATAPVAATPAATVTATQPVAYASAIASLAAKAPAWQLGPKGLGSVGGTNAASAAAVLATLQAGKGTATGAQLVAACAALGNYQYPRYLVKLGKLIAA